MGMGKSCISLHSLNKAWAHMPMYIFYQSLCPQPSGEADQTSTHTSTRVKCTEAQAVSSSDTVS